ncbi:MAG: serine protease [Burkholderiaceae bacterium]
MKSLRISLPALLLAVLTQVALAQAPAAPSPSAPPPSTPSSPAPGAPAGQAAQPPSAVPVSRDARRAYDTARDKLVQIRTVLRNTNTQAGVGSGFFVEGGLLITNFHVASQLALEPDRYRGVFVPVDGKESELELLAFDVQNDLAVLRPKQPAAGQPVLGIRGKEEPLARGERIYSLGNPLDIGFAVTEGTYNGLVQRSFYPRIFFGGALNPGMSGGPALDDSGRVVGVNVAKRLDGDLVSFLIPVEFTTGLLEKARAAQPVTKAAHAEITRQLMAHQGLLVQRFTGTPLRVQQHGGYGVPVPEDSMARCWGEGREPTIKAFEIERTDCRVDSHVYAGNFNTGNIELRYEAYEAPKMNSLRFARMYSQSFRNERFPSRGTRHKTAAECSERFVETGGAMPMRAVVCMVAYRKFPGLYDMSILTTSVNQARRGVQGRLDARGVSFDNGLKLAAFYLDGFRWEARP